MLALKTDEPTIMVNNMKIHKIRGNHCIIDPCDIPNTICKLVKRNDRDDLLIQFCKEHSFIMTNTDFQLPHKKLEGA